MMSTQVCTMVILSRNVTVCSSFWKKGTGLMFTKKKKDFAYVFAFSSPRPLMITMMFVFYPIDILFVKDGKVVEVATGVKPFGHYTPSVHADTFVELPAGKARQSYLGQKLSWSPSIVEIAHK